jgi:hypothetical protein
MSKTLHRSASLLTALALVAGVGMTNAAPVFATDTQAPPAVTNLAVSPTNSTNGTAVLTWTAPNVSDVAYYEVFRYNGTQTPATSPITYIGRTEDARTYLIDQIPTEGTFRYAVLAVDAAGNAGPASNWVTATVDLPGNGTTIQPDVTAPALVANLQVAARYSKNRTVTLTWKANTEADVWRYLVYRKDPSSDIFKMSGYVAATSATPTTSNVKTFSDLLTADGNYTYYVLAQDETGNVTQQGYASVVATVDNAVPVVQITAPIAGQTYQASGNLSIAATITDALSGYETTAVKYYLDGVQMATPVLTLNTLTGAHTVKVEVTDRAGNIGSAEAQFIVGSVVTNPAAPQNLTAPTYAKTRSVVLSWQAPTSGTAIQYLVYRTATGGTAELVGTAAPGATVTGVTPVAGRTYFSDTLSADGLYSYYVVAVASGGNLSPNSNTAASTVDATAPTVTVTAPQANHTYARSGSLTAQYAAADSLSGIDAAQTRLFLDNTAMTGTTIDLAGLTAGNHTFKVQVADRAGNTTTKTVTFSVGTPSNDNGDDDQQPDLQQALLQLMQTDEIQGSIHHGHYTALMAKLRAGNIRGFAIQVVRDRGKFITKKAADQILEVLGTDMEQIQSWSDQNDDEETWSHIQYDSNTGRGNGHGKGGK